MGDDVFDFQGWDAIEASIREHAAVVGYVTLVEKVPQADGTKEETVDSFDFEGDERAAVIAELRQREADAEPADPWEPPHTDLDDDAELHEDEEDPPDDDEVPVAARAELIRDALVLRCIAKLRASAQENIIGERSKVFLVRVMMPKGGRCLKRAQFTLRNLGPVNEDRPTAIVAPTNGSTAMPVYDAPIGLASLRAFQGLAHHYERFADMVHHHSKRTLSLEGTTNERLHAQLRDAYRQIDALTGHIITLRSMTSDEDKAALKHMSSAERSRLAGTAIDRFGDVAKAFFLSRGMTEPAIKIVNLLGSHPKIQALLGRLDVVAVLSDPVELDQFADGLYRIVDMSALAYAERQAAKAANPNATSQP